VTAPILSCGHIDLIDVPAKTARGKDKVKFSWRLWKNNAEMIADAFSLYVDLDKDRVLDPTYGAGNFYTVARPKKLIARDIRIDGFDVRHMSVPEIKDGKQLFGRRVYKAGSFNAVVLDFPFVSKGGRDTSTIPGMDEAYGMYDAPRTPRQVQDLIEAGMSASHPLLVDGGYLFVKTMNYVSSGKSFDSIRFTKEHAEKLEMEYVDEFIYSNGIPGPQPETNVNGTARVQVHARFNFSALLVFRKD
jgi:hypothetical protein